MTRAGRRKKQKRKLELGVKRDDPKALLREALRLLRSGELQRAADVATRAGRVAIDDASKDSAREIAVEARFRAAFASPFEKRLSLLDEAVALEPGQPRLHFHRAIARIPFGQLNEALEDLDVVAAAEPDRPGLALVRAFVAIGVGQPFSVGGLDDAERAMIEAVHGFVNVGAAHSVTVEPWQTLSKLATGHHGDPSVLANFAEQSIPRVAGMFRYYEGIARIRRGELDEAEFAVALALTSGYRPDHAFENGLKLARAGLIATASTGNWVRAAEFVPDSGPSGDDILDETASVVLFHQGWDAARAGDWKAARDAWDRANRLKGSRSLAQNLALAAEALGEWHGAGDAWRQMIRRRPRSAKHPDALTDGQVAALWLHASDCYVRAADFVDDDQAASCARNALKYASADDPLCLAAGKRLAELGDDASAEQAYEWILQADPDNVGAIEALGLLQLNRWPLEAVPMLRRLVELEPERPGAREALVSAYAEAGRVTIDFAPERAEESLREGLALMPEAPQLLFMLGRVRQAQWKEAEAADLFRRAILAPTERHDASAAAFHELLHLPSQTGVTREIYEALLTDPRSNAGFWLDQATSTLECNLDEEWAQRFLDQAIERSEHSVARMTRIAAIVASYRIVTASGGSEELLKRYEKRAAAETANTGAIEAIRAARATERNENRSAARLFAQARRLAEKAGDSSLRREIDFLEAHFEQEDSGPEFGMESIPPELLLEFMRLFPDGPPSDERKIPKELLNEIRKYFG